MNYSCLLFTSPPRPIPQRLGARVLQSGERAGALGEGDSRSRLSPRPARRALPQAYLGVHVFAPRHAGLWLDEGS